MSIENQFYLNKNPNLVKYLHENPKYYKYLNRDTNFIYEMEKLMRESYKMTIPDKIDNFKNKLEMITSFIDIIN